MKVYVLIQEDRHYDTVVTVFKDRAESTQTAAARIQRDVNRWRAAYCKSQLAVEQIVELGVMLSDDMLVRDIEDESFGLTESMMSGDEPWVFYCNAYDDGPTFRVVETDLVK